MTQNCDSQRLVYWAAGSGDFYQIHYDKDFAQGTGLPDRIVHGALKHALLGRMLHEWAGDEGRVRSVACQYRGMDMVDKDVICKGVVTGKRRKAATTWWTSRSGRRTRTARRPPPAPPPSPCRRGAKQGRPSPRGHCRSPCQGRSCGGSEVCPGGRE